MQKGLLTVATAAALVFTSVGARAENDGFFVNAGAGSSRYDISRTNYADKKDTAFGVNGGYRWAVGYPFFFGVEAGYVDLGTMSDTVRYGTTLANQKYSADFSGKAVLLGLNGKWVLPRYWTLTARLGLARSRTESKVEYSQSAIADGAQSSQSFNGTSNDNGLYAGVGFGYDFTPEFGLTANYDHYTLRANALTGDKRTVNVSVFGLVAEYRF